MEWKSGVFKWGGCIEHKGKGEGMLFQHLNRPGRFPGPDLLTELYFLSPLVDVS